MFVYEFRLATLMLDCLQCNLVWVEKLGLYLFEPNLSVSVWFQRDLPQPDGRPHLLFVAGWLLGVLYDWKSLSEMPLSSFRNLYLELSFNNQFILLLLLYVSFCEVLNSLVGLQVPVLLFVFLYLYGFKLLDLSGEKVFSKSFELLLLLIEKTEAFFCNFQVLILKTLELFYYFLNYLSVVDHGQQVVVLLIYRHSRNCFLR